MCLKIKQTHNPPFFKVAQKSDGADLLRDCLIIYWWSGQPQDLTSRAPTTIYI